jgi:hypothetical protein
MSSPINAILTGSFTSDGLVRNIILPSGYTQFNLVNISDIGSTAANTDVMLALGMSAMLAGSAYYTPKTSGAATLDPPVHTLTGGFTFIGDSGLQTPEAALAVTSATNASPPVLTMTSSTGNILAGDILRYYNASGQFNIAGMDFTAGTVVANTSIALAYMGAPGGAGTGGSVHRIPFDARYYPRNRYITAITKASSAVITLSVTHGYTVGQAIRVVVPAAFGMTEINGLIGNITAIDTSTNTITVNIDSTSFTTFAFPASATPYSKSFAEVTPVGEAAINSSSQPYGNLLDDATRNASFRGVQIGATVQTTGKVYQWIALKGLSI